MKRAAKEAYSAASFNDATSGKITSCHEGRSPAKPQPKAKKQILPRGHEEHEVKKFKNISVRNLRGLRVLRGE